LKIYILYSYSIANNIKNLQIYFKKIKNPAKSLDRDKKFSIDRGVKP